MDGRFRKRLGVFVVIVIVVVLAAACGDDEGPPAGATETPEPTGSPPEGSPEPNFPVTVTDSNDRRVRFQEPARRIVALSPGPVEMLFAIGAGEGVVGVSEDTNFPPETAEITRLSGSEPDADAIAALDPDLAILPFDPGGVQHSLDQQGINSLVFSSPATLSGIYEQIAVLGLVTNHEGDATQLVIRLDGRVAPIELALRDVDQGPRVLHEMGFGSDGVSTVGPGSFVDDVYATLKAENTAADAGAVFPVLPEEDVIAKDPEVIILTDGPAGVTPNSVKARAGWEKIAAVKDGRVFSVDPEILIRPGPRVVDGLEELARILYPERF